MLYALYHTESETVGLLGELLQKEGLKFEEIHLYRESQKLTQLHDVDGLIVMGGPMNVDEIKSYPFLEAEVLLIQQLIRMKKPVLGICLGAQLLAKALGAKVYANGVREVGWHPISLTQAALSDPLFSSWPTELTVLHWHGDTFTLPSGSVHLASSPRCVNQAFRFGDNAYGLQFHLEVTEPMAKDWISSSDGGTYLEGAGETSQVQLQKTPVACSTLQPWAMQFFSGFINHLLTPVQAVSR